jgi:hypothetical protein
MFNNYFKLVKLNEVKRKLTFLTYEKNKEFLQQLEQILLEGRSWSHINAFTF